MTNKKKDQPKRQPTGDYEVGYAKPPESGKFTSDQQHIRRRSRSSKSAPAAPTGNDAAKNEAERIVDVRNGDSIESLRAYDANLRALGIHGIKGSRLHAKEFLDRADRAEEKRRREAEEWATGIYALKDFWRDFAPRYRERFGTEPEPPIPHPDDFVIDPETGEYVLDGPGNHDEHDMLVELIKILKSIRRKAIMHRNRWLKNPSNRGNASDMVFYVYLFVTRNNDLPERYRLKRLPATPPSLVTPEHVAVLERIAA